MTSIRTQKEHRERILAVLAFIREHGQTDHTLSELAMIACQSPFHFGRVFQAQTGVKPMAHLRRFRLLRAALALRLTQQKIVEIALDAGYTNHESFSRAFRVMFGESPRGFRKRITAVKHKEQQTMFQATIKLVKIPVTDFNRATRFYREVLGLEEEFAVEAYGWAQYKTGNIPLCLYVTGQGGGDGMPGHEVGFHLEVENIRDCFATIQQRGGQFATEIVGSADGGYFFMLRDPDGNQFKVVQRLS